MQLYKAYKANGSSLGFLEPRNEEKLNSNVYLKAVTCFVIDKNTNKILLEKRTSKGMNPDQYDLVSGHVNGTEVGIQAMIRELQEEVGIQVEESSANIIKISESIPMSFESKGKLKKFFVEFFCLPRNSTDLTLQESEVDSIEWVDMEEAFRMIQQGETKFPKDFDYEPIFQKVMEVCLGKNKICIEKNK